jgi:pSer/pThr/pTyr-binding forkhead associated (FHA) protein
MAFIIIEKGNSQDIGKKFSLGEEPVQIGRATPENNPSIALHDEFVSRLHLDITFSETGFMLRDLNSTNGTSLDEIRIDPGKSYRLKHDSAIGLGIFSEGARVILRFKETPTVSTTRIEVADLGRLIGPGWLRIDAKKDEIWVDEKLLVLSRKEYDLLVYLSGRAGEICQRDELISKVWPEVVDPGGVSDAAIDQLIHRLRLKIEPDPAKPQRLISKKGFGYALK